MCLGLSTRTVGWKRRDSGRRRSEVSRGSMSKTDRRATPTCSSSPLRSSTPRHSASGVGCGGGTTHNPPAPQQWQTQVPAHVGECHVLQGGPPIYPGRGRRQVAWQGLLGPRLASHLHGGAGGETWKSQMAPKEAKWGQVAYCEAKWRQVASSGARWGRARIIVTATATATVTATATATHSTTSASTTGDGI